MTRDEKINSQVAIHGAEEFVPTICERINLIAKLSGTVKPIRISNYKIEEFINNIEALKVYLMNKVTSVKYKHTHTNQMRTPNIFFKFKQE